MKIAALRRKAAQDRAHPIRWWTHYYARPQLKDLIAASDYLLLATPLTPETRGMIGAAEIAAMKPSAVLINIGRGPVVDEAALIHALESGKIRGAALDVFTVEPLPAGHPFYRMTNVLVSPHTADRVEGFLGPPVDAFLENLERFLKGEPLRKCGGQACRLLTSKQLSSRTSARPPSHSSHRQAHAGDDLARLQRRRRDRGVLQMRESANRRRVQDPRARRISSPGCPPNNWRGAWWRIRAAITRRLWRSPREPGARRRRW